MSDKQSVHDLINEIIRVEGGYVDHPNDPGGATKYGITEKVARAAGYKGPMKDLPIELARSIYWDQYVVKPGFHFITPPDLLAEVVDTGVNMGPATAAKFLQRALNAVAGSGLTVDGQFGARSRQALTEYLQSRKGADVILTKAVNCLQGARYIELVEANSKNRSFINGWIANRT